jgi:hypothetical protein
MLRSGETLEFLGLSFVAAARDPIVGSHKGEIAFSPSSTGHIYAPWPTRQDDYALEFEGRATGESFEVVVDADAGPDEIYGTRLEYRTSHPAGLFLRRGWDLLALSQDVPINDDWHRVRIEARDEDYRVFFDDFESPILTTYRRQPGSGLGLGGRGSFRKLGWSALD